MVAGMLEMDYMHWNGTGFKSIWLGQKRLRL